MIPHNNSPKAYQRALREFKNFAQFLGYKTPEDRLELARKLWLELMGEELLDKYEDSKTGKGKQSQNLRPDRTNTTKPRKNKM